MSGYIGNIPTPQATQTRDTFTATAGQTTFATSGYTPSFLDVFMNGVHLVNGTDYTASNGSDVVLTSGAAAGDTLEVVAFSTFEVATDDLTVTGNLSVDGGTIKLDGNYPVGTGNVALGDTALDSNVSGIFNTAIGADALTANTASANTAIGYQAGYDLSTGTGNMFAGIRAGQNTTTGVANTFVGGSFSSYAGSANTTGNYNTALGSDALASNTTASGNTALGYQAAYSNTTGAENVLIGYKTGYASTTANGLTAVGRQALEDNTASNNTAIGFAVLANNTTGGFNTALGGANYGFTGGAMHLNTTGSYNTALGNQALHNNTTASKNTALGYQAGYNTTTGYENVFVGYQSGYNNTGYGNNYIGYGAGALMTSGNANTILGKFSGNQGGLDIRTSSNNIVLSDGDGNPRMHWNSSNTSKFEGTATTIWRTDTTAGAAGCKIAYNTFPNAHYEMTVGASGTAGTNAIIFSNGNGIVGTIATNGLSTAYNTSSDYRLKEDVQPMTGATSRLLSLKPVNFAWKADGSRVDGFLAHEVQAIVPEAIHGTKDEVDADGNPVYQGIDQSKLVPLLVATIKELEARIATLEAN